ncbi:MAG TPA: DUF1844 domain-containing protein [Pyrinomonadaceae bacterium]|nr:DUF1844 domain-containing protein [Pyrinomonadaceae bacterium]
MSEEQNSFKVTDRRLFNPDGTPRELTPEEQQQIATASAPAAPTTPSPTESPANTASILSPGLDQKEQEPKAAATSVNQEEADEEFVMPDDRDPASFINFLMSIASNAASALGMIEHPVTQQRDVDLELAKHWIDVLGMLHQKTRGNLNSQEQQILEGLLADLRMQYVSLTSSPQAKAARPFSGRDITGGK